MACWPSSINQFSSSSPSLRQDSLLTTGINSQSTEKTLESNERKGLDVDTKGILKFAKQHWNKSQHARWNDIQIRNAFHTTIAMVESDTRGRTDKTGYGNTQDIHITVGLEQSGKIAKTAREFDEYLHETMGMSYEENLM
ncbi:hypothetical protein CC78DRAFT_580088 [Lojkania enalia]|uniref:AAA+ ATPase lid domain-containing protein n=1 Tax=Lojkania enalia TaxID=147567 RepID=A0A9P4KAS4_9PLEO|nr:hypothetical protein CC78DRAFT_580088 [Didymosphaeria enalia]